MEIPNYDDFTEKELYKIRRFQNSKIEIYQYSNEPLIRPKKVTQEYSGSFEQKQLLNSCLKTISNLSSLLYLSSNEEKPIQLTIHNLKKLFQKSELLNREYDISNLEMNQMNFMKKIKFERIKNEKEYKELCKFIESPGFDYVMRTQKNIAKWILTHEYLIYHPNYEEIKHEYSIVLCPSYIFPQESEDNNDIIDAENEENHLDIEDIQAESENIEVDDDDYYDGNTYSNNQDDEQWQNTNNDT